MFMLIQIPFSAIHSLLYRRKFLKFRETYTKKIKLELHNSSRAHIPHVIADEDYTNYLRSYEVLFESPRDLLSYCSARLPDYALCDPLEDWLYWYVSTNR